MVKRLSLFLFAVVLSVLGSVSNIAYAWSVPNVKQVYSNWCWAADGSSVLNYYGKNVSQYDFARYVNGGYNYPATSANIQYGLNHWGVSSSWTNYYGNWNYPYYSFIQGQINNGKPMITLITWQNGSGGHFHVVDGWFTSNGYNYITYMDPWYGDHYYYNYQSYKSNGSFFWRELIWNMYKNW